MTPCVRWLLRARPGDYVLALSVAGASLPVVGKHLEPLGGVTAMGVWGARHAPEFDLGDDEGLADAGHRRGAPPGSGEHARRSRSRPCGGSCRPPIWTSNGPRQNGRRRFGRRCVSAATSIAAQSTTGTTPRRCSTSGAARICRLQPAPVLIFVPGGAWVHGRSMLQGSALMSRLAEQGWVCLAIDYRVAPHHRWPRHITDVKTAIAWARANVDKFGGDRNFVAVAGCSAGGHLSALAGLTPDDPQYEAKLPEGADSSVDAVVGIYGRYDWEDRSTPERDRFVEFSGAGGGQADRSPVTPRCSATRHRSRACIGMLRRSW